MKSLLWSLAVWQTFGVATCLAAGDGPAMGTIELTVRGPDGKPLASTHLVLSLPKPPQPQSYSAPPSFAPPPGSLPGAEELADMNAVTDASGRVSFAMHVGKHRIAVQVPGVGYGNTGLVDVESNAVAKPSLPPLMPFGRIEGRLPQDQVGPGRTFNLPDDMYVKRRIACEPDGRFIADDLRIGSVWIRPYAAGKKLETMSYVYVRPGQQTTHVGFRQEKSFVSPVVATPAPKATAKSVPGPFAATGTVRDLAGRPIAEADVFIVGAYMGGMRMSPVLYSTKSDAAGRWKFDNPEQFFFGDGDLVAHKAGYAYTAVPLRHQVAALRAAAENAALVVPSYDLVLSPHGGTLEVALLQDGTPLSNVPVKVVATQSPSRRLQALHTPSEMLQPIVEPVLVTDERGVAKFTDLPPDNYRIVAIAGDQQALAGFHLPYDFAAKTYGLAEPIAVRAGRTTKFSLVVKSHAQSFDLRFNSPDGRPISGRRVEFHASNMPRDNFDSSVEFDGAGAAKWRFARDGIWSLQLRYGTNVGPSMSKSTPPYHEGAIALGVSPLLPQKMVEPVTATLIKPGSLEVRLEDADGRPMAGYVQTNLYIGHQLRVGSTDDAGRIRFDDEPANPVTVSAFLKSRPLPSLGFGDEPFADDAAFVGHQEFLDRTVRLANDVVTPVTLRAVKVGYVRGVVHPAPGKTPADYYIDPMWPHPRPANRYNGVTGEFVCGPLPLGEATIWLLENGASTKAMRYKQQVEVRHDRVARIDLRPAANAQPGQRIGDVPEPPLVAVDFAAKLSHYLPATMHGRVVEADGKTPAWGAQLFTIEPGHGVVRARGYADTAGRFNMKSVGIPVRHLGDDDFPPPPRVSTLIALRPGSTGATVVEITKEMLDREFTIKLPPATGALGRVTVGGKSIAGRTSTFRIVATYESRDAVGTQLDVETQPDAEGNFELGGFTAGKYVVQASMDGIWFSKPTTRTISAAQAKLPPLDLDIGTPGRPTLVRCVDTRGAPIIGARATLTLPAGPLAEKFIPSDYRSDGAGLMHLPPLEAGPHLLKFEGQSLDLRFEVAPLGEGNRSGDAEPNLIKATLTSR